MVKGELQSEWYRAINPNGKAPAIVHVRDDGTTQRVFESAACLLYMASEFDKEHKFSYPVGTPEYWTQLSWVCLKGSAPFGSQLSDLGSNSSHGKSPATGP